MPGADGKTRQRRPELVRFIWRPTSTCSWIATNWTTPRSCSIGWTAFPIRALTVALRAELLYREKEWGKVPEFLADYVSQGKANKDPPDRVLLAAQLLERLAGRLDPRRGNLARTTSNKPASGTTSYVQPRPGGEMLLAGFHARRGEVEAALREIERYGEKSRPEEVFEVVDTIVSRPETKPAQLTALESLIVALIDKTHRPTLLLVALAEIQSARDRPQDAEKIYREILRKDPRDDMACNNLSMMLALQETKLDEALELIDKTIARAGPQGAFLDTRAVVRIAAARAPAGPRGPGIGRGRKGHAGTPLP